MMETECIDCDGYGSIWNNADPTSGQRVDCPTCLPSGTDGPWFVVEQPVLAVVAREGNPVIAHITAVSDQSNGDEELANARMLAAAPTLAKALAELVELFPLPDENSLERFERLAAMFRKDTGYLAPGKDQPMGGADQPDGDELRAIYDAWYQAKVDRARTALASLDAGSASS